ncbi:MAG: hypothetical protein QXT58_04595 [Archaeoglobaceae archaeon]
MCVALKTLRGANLTIGSALRLKDGREFRWNPEFPFRRCETLYRQYRGKPEKLVFLPVPILSFVERNTHGYERSVRRYEESVSVKDGKFTYAVFVGEPVPFSRGFVSLITEENPNVGGPFYHPRRPFLVEASSWEEAQEAAFKKLFCREEE